MYIWCQNCQELDFQRSLVHRKCNYLYVMYIFSEWNCEGSLIECQYDCLCMYRNAIKESSSQEYKLHPHVVQPLG